MSDNFTQRKLSHITHRIYVSRYLMTISLTRFRYTKDLGSPVAHSFLHSTISTVDDTFDSAVLTTGAIQYFTFDFDSSIHLPN